MLPQAFLKLFSSVSVAEKLGAGEAIGHAPRVQREPNYEPVPAWTHTLPSFSPSLTNLVNSMWRKVCSNNRRHSMGARADD